MLPKLQEMILLIVHRLGPDCTATDVQEALTNARGSEQAFGAVFTTLDRMTAKKFVAWRKGEPEQRRGGRAPRLYTITGIGRMALAESLQTTHAVQGEEQFALSPPATAPSLRGVGA